MKVDPAVCYREAEVEVGIYPWDLLAIDIKLGKVRKRSDYYILSWVEKDGVLSGLFLDGV